MRALTAFALIFVLNSVGSGTAINEPPALSFVPNQSIAADPATGASLLSAGTTLVIAVSSSDPNPQDTLSLTAFFGTAGTMPPGATFTQTSPGTGVFTWTPLASQAGVWSPANAATGKPPLTVVVQDDGAPMLQHVQTVSISIGPSANASPHLHFLDTATRAPLPASVFADAGDTLAFDVYCFDENAADLLTLAASATTPLPAGASLAKVVTARDNPLKYAFRWNVQPGQAGGHHLDFVCGDGAIDERRSVDFEITGPAAAPRIVGLAPNQGPGVPGLSVTVIGTALGLTTAVRFGGEPVPFTALNNTTLAFTTTMTGALGPLADVEVAAPLGLATRGDAFLYTLDADTDRDGVLDTIEGTADWDGDGAVNLNDPDSDADGIADAVEFVDSTGGDANSDFDFLPDYLDDDSDDDGIADRVEGPSDLDNDGIPNYRDQDADGDSVPDVVDNCAVAPNAGQADADFDGVGDVCDNDSDNDGLPNAFEVVYGTSSIDPDTDDDGRRDGDEVFLSFTNPLALGAGGTDEDLDGVFLFPDGSGDNCPATPNGDQSNFDLDARGDACDGNDDNDLLLDTVDHCPTEVGHPRGNGCRDEDFDGVFVTLDGGGDNCPVTPNGDQLDFDLDLLGDACDDNDDNDPLPDTADHCPFEAGHPRGNGCRDEDFDGVFVTLDGGGDNCPVTPNGDQLNSDDDADGDACDDNDDNDPLLDAVDHCPTEAGHPRGNGCLDEDLDAVFVFPDGSGDNCPVTPNPDQLNTDGDADGNACDPNDDNDPLLDEVDHCPLEAGHPRGNGCLDEDFDAVFVLLDGSGDNCPVTPNGDQLNSDDDPDGDACDDNDDNDPLLDAVDHCPTQAGHPRGNGCLDEDLDAVFVLLDGSGDNCPVTPNGDQRDTDGDGAGDACDADDDNDGFLDAVDGCPLVPGTIGGCPPVANGTPSCAGAVATVGSLWPANHKMVAVGIQGLTDPDGDPITVSITSIRQDELTNTAGDGNTSCDATGVGGPLAQVRAERAGNGDGRFYHVFFTADDGRGGACTGSVRVAVPHDRSKSPLDGGPLYPSCR